MHNNNLLQSEIQDKAQDNIELNNKEQNILLNDNKQDKNEALCNCTGLNKLNVGGQAVLEGVMMRSRRFWAIAVRRPDNTISTDVFKEISIMNRKKILGFPFIRGVVALVENMSLGFKALSYSVNEATGEEVQMSKKQMGISVAIAVVFTVGLFFILPTVIGRSFSNFIPNAILYNLLEGIIRIAFLIGYIAIISFMKDIKRLFQYHGAEHKTIQAYEYGEELIPENIRKYSRLHLRCGTSFLLIVMVVSLFVFALLGKPPLYLRIISRVLLIPVIAGISYELIRFAGKFSKNRIVHILFYPGLLLQKITTREPDDAQLEVATMSLKKILEAENTEAQDDIEKKIVARPDDVAINA